jgi:hypothetical protein
MGPRAFAVALLSPLACALVCVNWTPSTLFRSAVFCSGRQAPNRRSAAARGEPRSARKGSRSLRNCDESLSPEAEASWVPPVFSPSQAKQEAAAVVAARQRQRPASRAARRRRRRRRRPGRGASRTAPRSAEGAKEDEDDATLSSEAEVVGGSALGRRLSSSISSSGAGTTGRPTRRRRAARPRRERGPPARAVRRPLLWRTQHRAPRPMC